MTRDDLTRLFEAERAVRPTPGELERGLGRLLGDLARGVAPLPVATSSLKLGLSLASKWLAVGFVAGLGGAGAASQILASNAAAAPSSASRAAAVTTVSSPERQPRLPTAPATHEAPAERTVARVAPSTPHTAAVASAGLLAEEMRLIAAAKRDIEGGRPELAAAWLTEHAARFPRGVFATEREGLTILISCGRQKNPQLVQQFAAAHPSSPLVERLERICATRAGSDAPALNFPKSDK